MAPTDDPSTTDDLLTVYEAARLARRSPSTLRNRRHAGLPPRPCSLPGMRILYRRADVLAWVLGDATADDRPPVAVPEAEVEAWIRDELAGGPRLAAEMRARCPGDRRTVDRVKAAIGVVSARSGYGWTWSMPPDAS